MSAFCITDDSVTSRISLLGSSPVAMSAPATIASKRGSSSWRADTFTVTGTSARPSRSQPCASAQAAFSTHSPSATIAPVCSAKGMNSSGDTSPRPGRCQRSSASAARTSPVSRSMIGW
jgi:hypothetical protein